MILICLFFMEKGAKLNEKNGDGETPSDILRKEGIYLWL